MLDPAARNPLTHAAPAPRSPLVRFIRRFAAALILSVIAFVVLWMTVFNAVNSALVASGGGIVIVAGSSASETFQSIFEAIAEFILGLFGAICDFFSSIFD
jgi:uncharacterized RDD family membrane protein YckC